MANESLALSSRHRNSILRIFPANNRYLHEKHSFLGSPPPYSFSELGTLMGLAFTAILAEESNVDYCRPYFNIFLQYRNTLYPDIDMITSAILQIFQSGLSAFKVLGHPYYYDDFIWACSRILNTDNVLPFKIKQEMQRILQIML